VASSEEGLRSLQHAGVQYVDSERLTWVQFRVTMYRGHPKSPVIKGYFELAMARCSQHRVTLLLLGPQISNLRLAVRLTHACRSP
jgi:hypothetical protein